MLISGSSSASGRGPVVTTLPSQRFFGEMTMLWGVRRTKSVYANTPCVVAKLKRDNYLGLVTRGEMQARSRREELLRNVPMFETLSQEHISRIDDALEVKIFEPGEKIIQQNEEGNEFYVIQEGECRVTIETGSNTESLDVQEHKRCHPGDLFGELALLKQTTRAANVEAVSRTVALCLSRRKFTRMLGPLNMLQETNYLRDPRKCIADFYQPGDERGPRGALTLAPMMPPAGKQTEWFAVYRPCSRDAIAKMLSGKAVGKGLNVKGKSAKKNHLAGFVPYLQISEERHKESLEESEPGNRLTIYYTRHVAREIAIAIMQPYLERQDLVVGGERALLKVDRYPDVFGLDIPECIMRAAYITDADITFLSGWETGRQSEPAFMNMNIHSLCATNKVPETVLYQMDAENPMNAHSLLVAYAETSVKPVVSDFDTFTVGSRGMHYEALPKEQQDLACWSLDRTEMILRSPGMSSWNSRWLEVLKEANASGFHPAVPRYGFGDGTSYQLIQSVVNATVESGAVRHGAECFNYYFPQELDDDYLVIWEGFDDKPWNYLLEDDLREWLLERIEEGFSFPLNPVWPARDDGWFEVWRFLWEEREPKGTCDSWYPSESDIRKKVDKMHDEFPDGFRKLIERTENTEPMPSPKDRMSMVEDVDSRERAVLLLQRAENE